MSWTYSGDPSRDPKDAVRFLIGDTDSCAPLLLDGEINYMLKQYNYSVLGTSIRCIETIMAKFARLCDESVGQVSLSLSQKMKGYQMLKAQLMERIALEEAVPYAGGISVSDKITQTDNTDRVKPDFTKHMMENEQISPWVTNQTDPYDRNGEG